MKRFIVGTIAFLLFAALLLSMTACSTIKQEPYEPVVTEPPGNIDSGNTDLGNNKVYIKFFKCGKADSFLIRTATKTVLIDAGEDDDYDKILTYIAEKGVTKIDYLIVTQYNKNHVGSLDAILSGIKTETEEFSAVKVDRILAPSYTKTGTTADAYAAALNKAGKTSEKVTGKMTLDIDGAELVIYPSDVMYTGLDFDEYNSLVITLSYGGNNVLFAGDIFGARISEIAEKISGKAFDIIKVPNHGIYNPQSEMLISSVKARYAIITASEKNPADTRIVTYLNNAGAEKVYITKDGSVEVRLGNGYYQIKQSELEWNTVNK